MQRLKVGDLAQVIAGKNKGKRGKVIKLDHGRDRVTIEGVNLVVRHERPSQQNTEGGRTTREAPIHASNVMPVSAETDKPTRVHVVTGEDGTKRRAGKGGAEIKQG